MSLQHYSTLFILVFSIFINLYEGFVLSIHILPFISIELFSPHIYTCILLCILFSIFPSLPSARPERFPRVHFGSAALRVLSVNPDL